MVDEEMRQAMEAVMKARLKEALQMTPEQEARVMPKVEKLQDARHDFAGSRRKAVSHLRAVMMDETSSPADLEKALREVRALETSFREREQGLRTEIDAELEPRQQARLYFFEERFRREMQRRLMEGAGPRGPGGPYRGPGAGPGPGGGAGPDGAPPDEPEPESGGDGEL